MLGIPDNIAAEIAGMPTAHSWLAPLLKKRGEDYERTQEKLEAAIEEISTKMYPEAERAGRLVREVAGMMLEHEAMEAWIEKNPFLGMNLGAPMGPYEATELAAMEVMYVSREEKEAAMEILEMLQEGMLTQTLLKAIE